MFSGKTTEMFLRVRRARQAGLNTAIYKYQKDVRYGEMNLASSHDRITEQAIPISNAEEIQWSKGMVIGIDEGQFIEKLDIVAQLMANEGVTVIIAALDTNFQRKPWPIIQKLWFLTDRRTHKHAVCFQCKRDACFSYRVVENKDEELLGGTESYIALCRKCWNIKNLTL